MNAPAKRISYSRMKATKIQAAPRNVRAVDPRTLGVVDQVRVAMRPRMRLAAMLGAFLGSLVPLTSYVVAHYELRTDVPLYAQVGTVLVLGGLLFSATTIYTLGKLAFQSAPKALGFVLLTEGALIFARTPWLGWVALAYLVTINAVATGCTLALDIRPEE